MSSHSMVRRSSVRNSITSTPQKLELEVIPGKTPNRRKSQQTPQSISIRTDSSARKVVLILGNLLSSSRSRSDSRSNIYNDIYSDDSDASCSSTDSANIERLEKKAEELNNTLELLKTKKMLKEKRERCDSLNKKTTPKTKTVEKRGRPKIIKTVSDRQTPTVKRKRGRPRKYPIAESTIDSIPNINTPSFNQFDSILETRRINNEDDADESLFDRHRASAEACLYQSPNINTSRSPMNLNADENEPINLSASVKPLEACRISISSEDLGDVFDCNNEHVLSQAIESLEPHALTNERGDTVASPAMRLHNIVNENRDEQPIPSCSWNAKPSQINMSEADIDAILEEADGMNSAMLNEVVSTPKKMWKAKLKNANVRNETNESNRNSEIGDLQCSNNLVTSKVNQVEACSNINNKVNSLANERVSVPNNCIERTTNGNASLEVVQSLNMSNHRVEEMVNSGEFNSNLSTLGNDDLIGENDITNTGNLVSINTLHENGPQNVSPDVFKKNAMDEESLSSTKQCSKKRSEPTWKKRVSSQRNSYHSSSSDDDSTASETTRQRRRKSAKIRRPASAEKKENEHKTDNSLESSPDKKAMFKKKISSNSGLEVLKNQTTDSAATLKTLGQESSTDGGYTSNVSHADVQSSQNSDAALLSLDTSLFENPALTHNNEPITKRSIQDNLAQSKDGSPENDESNANRELVREPSTDGGYNSNICANEDPSSQNSDAASLSLDSSLMRSSINAPNNKDSPAKESSTSKRVSNSENSLPVTIMSMGESKPSNSRVSRSESYSSDSNLDLNEAITKNEAIINSKESDSDDLSSSDDDFESTRTPKVVQQVDLASNVNTDRDSDEDDSDIADEISVKELLKSKEAAQQYCPDDTVSDVVSLSDNESVRVLACSKIPKEKISQGGSSDDDNSDYSSRSESEVCQKPDQKQKVYISPDDSSSDSDSSHRFKKSQVSSSKKESNGTGSCTGKNNSVQSSEDSDDDGTSEITHLLTTKRSIPMTRNEDSSSDSSSSDDDNDLRIIPKNNVKDKKNSLESDDSSDSSSEDNEKPSLEQNKKQSKSQLKPKHGPVYLSPDDSASDDVDDKENNDDVKSEAEEKSVNVTETNYDYMQETKEEESIDIFTEAKEEVDESAIWVSLSQKSNPHNDKSNWFQRRLDIENNLSSVSSREDNVEYSSKKKKKKKKEKRIAKDTEALEVESSSQEQEVPKTLEKKKKNKKGLAENEESADNSVEPRSLNKKRQSARNLKSVVEEEQIDEEKNKKNLATPDVVERSNTPDNSKSSGKELRQTESSEITNDSEVTPKKKKKLATPDVVERSNTPDNSKSSGKKLRQAESSEITIDSEETPKKKKKLATPDVVERSNTPDNSKSSGKELRQTESSEITNDSEVTPKKKKKLATPDVVERSNTPDNSKSSGKKLRQADSSEITIDSEVTSKKKKKKDLVTHSGIETSDSSKFPSENNLDVIPLKKSTKRKRDETDLSLTEDVPKKKNKPCLNESYDPFEYLPLHITQQLAPVKPSSSQSKDEKQKKKKKRNKKNKLKSGERKFMNGNDFIPLKTTGSTNFVAAPLSVNYGPCPPNADFKNRALFGDRVKRSSQKHLKVVSLKRNAKPF